MILSLSQQVSTPMNDDEKQKNYELAEKLISEQKFSAAVIVGAVATLLAAVAYGITVTTWPIAYGFAAAGVGIVIGSAMGFLGRGVSTKFAVAAAVYTLVGCALGSLFHVIINLAQATGNSPIDVLQNNSLSVLADRASSNVLSISLIYWFVAVIAAVFLSKRPLSRSARLAIGLYKLRG